MSYKYDKFKTIVYDRLKDYKEKDLNIKTKGEYLGKSNAYIFPEPYASNALPCMLYKGIVDTIKDIQVSKFAYKPHRLASKHVASSQTACLNLFTPILESSDCDIILKSSGIAPTNYDHIDRNEFRNGYCFEYWDGIGSNSKGLLGDHSKRAGTDSDVAIAYRDPNGNLCLWLIEHKLTEQEFTACGGFRSKSKKFTAEMKSYCTSCTISDITADHKLCHYHKNCNYHYWKIMDTSEAKRIFSGKSPIAGCPFRNGMNQLWRNCLLAIGLELKGSYHSVNFSVVSHPMNHFLDETISQFKKLTNNNERFSDFKSDKLINASRPFLTGWVKWYEKVYYGLDE
jgi:hypothetical protein